jgi:hypothetical protein
MPRTLVENFKVGDLIYGLDDYRRAAFGQTSEKPKSKKQMLKELQFDNNAIEEAIVAESERKLAPSLDPKHKRTVDDFNREFINLVDVAPEKNPRPTKGAPGDVSTGTFAQELLHSKYSPRALQDITEEDLKDPKNANLKRKLEKSKGSFERQRYRLAIRRSCKFGLEFVCMNSAKAIKIHFLLDGIDLEKVGKKEAFSGNIPITTSELRFAFRAWDRLGPTGKILFYIDNQQVPPPWEKQKDGDGWSTSALTTLSAKRCPGYMDLGIWERYAEERKLKHSVQQ